MTRMIDEAIKAIAPIEAGTPERDAPIKPRQFRLGDYKPTPDFFEVENRDTYHVYWGGYDYAIYFEEGDGAASILREICRIGRKGWPLLTTHRLARLGEVIAQTRGINLWSDR